MAKARLENVGIVYKMLTLGVPQRLMTANTGTAALLYAKKVEDMTRTAEYA